MNLQQNANLPTGRNAAPTAADGNTFVLLLDLVFDLTLDNEVNNEINLGNFSTSAPCPK